MSVDEGIIRHICGLICRTTGSQPADLSRSIFFKQTLAIITLNIAIFLQPISTRNRFRFDQLMRRSPRPGLLFVVELPMVNFSHVHRFVAMVTKVLRQSCDVGVGIAEVGIVLNHAIRIRTGSRHDRSTRWRTNRLLAVCPVKEQPLCGKRVDIRCNRDRRTIASHLGPHVIDRNEKNIGLLGSKRGSRQAED